MMLADVVMCNKIEFALRAIAKQAVEERTELAHWLPNLKLTFELVTPCTYLWSAITRYIHHHGP